MDLLEYQAKELFQLFGIPVLPSQRIDHPRELKGLTIPYPVVLKSQVYSGGRAKAGGIRFVNTTIDAIAAAQAIFHLPIMGQFPEVILAEAKYTPTQELYLAIALDRSFRRPVLLGSHQGGVDIDISDSIQRVVVDQEFSPFYARRLAIAMGLSGAVLNAVSAVVENMFRLFIQKDLDLIEINPLAVDSSGSLMALDGKVCVNDNALGRHSDLAALRANIPPLAGDTAALYRDLDVIELDGSIGLLCNGTGLTLTTLDLITQAGSKVACCIHLNSEFRHGWSAEQVQARLHRGLDVLCRDQRVRAILVNLCGDAVSCVEAAEAIATYLKRQSRGRESLPPLVVRLLGRDLDQGQAVLADLEITVVERLDDAIAQTIQYSRQRLNLVEENVVEDLQAGKI